MSDWGEDAMRHKYAPLPEDGPRHRKKAKKAHVRSDHKHVYEDVAIDSNMHVYRRGEGKVHAYEKGRRCKVCGRLANVRFTDMREPPEGMRLFEVDGFFALLDMKALPDDMEVTR